MQLNEKNIVIIGGCGQMGSGIVYCVISLCLKHEIKCSITVIDKNKEAYTKLINYLKETLLKKFNEQDIDYILKQLKFAESIKDVNKIDIAFEAIVEDEKVKIHCFKELKKRNSEIKILSNTSSIPISYLEEKSDLKSQIIGFHFYNPPAVQTLLELIPSKYTKESFLDEVMKLAKDLEKKVVVSKDIAGFIGNGFFIREGLYATELVKTLSAAFSVQEAVDIVNSISKDYLLRPMGIFELIDYVKPQIFLNIAKVMQDFILNEAFDTSMLKNILDSNVLLKNENSSQKVTMFLKNNPKESLNWKQIKKEKIPLNVIEKYVEKMCQSNEKDNEFACEYYLKIQEITTILLQLDIAKNEDDILRIRQLGFHHLI